MKLNIFAAAASIVLLGSAVSTQALAAEPAGVENAPYTVDDAVVRAECGDCHMVFPPNRLTQNGWRKIMAGLSDHFGENATLSAETVKHIEDYYVANAFDAVMRYPTKLRLESWKKKGIIDPIRITETPEWTSAHNSKKYKLMAEDKKYDRGSNCIICHKNAEKGYYEEFPGLYGEN